MTDRYQVVGECAHVVVTDPSGVSAMNLLYKGAFLPDGVDEVRLKHLLDSRLVAKVGEVALAPNAAVAQDGNVGIPPMAPEAPDEGNAGAGDGLTDEQRAAKAKLPADGSAPDGRASEAVWVEYAVSKGLDRGEATKAGREELRKALAGGK